MTPALSVVVITPDIYATVRKTIKHLRAQSISRSMEILLLAPSAKALNVEVSEMEGFLSYKIVEVGHINSTARARVAGVHEATAPIVAFAEDHAYPAPGWAEALVNRHKENWAAVGPVMANANPKSITSWANFLIEYAPWLDPAQGGEREHLPGHNCSYKRHLLLEYGDQLEAMMDAESILHWDLRNKSHRLYLEQKARTFHENFSAPAPMLPLRFHGGRLFASARAQEWTTWRRIMFAFASPLIPVVRCLRITRELFKPGRPRYLLPRVLPILMLGLVFDGAGEMMGYAFGAGGAMAKLSDMEFHRERYMS
ncbi:MAG TPA: glycosyltransferase [Pyrinomonadaceae bacterium]|nr:glycosyltransferase [Pyrinomonadaceae bacterium]